MNKLSKAARTLVVAKMKEQIKNCPLPEARQNLINSFIVLLINLDSYNGYNTVYWLEHGHANWIAAGKPLDNSPYIGDKTLIKLY